MFTPSDLFYIVLAFCVLWLTAGLFWLIYQIAALLRNVNETMVDARQKLALIEEAILGIRSGIERFTSSPRLLFDGVRSLAEFVASKRGSKKKQPPRSRKE